MNPTNPVESWDIVYASQSSYVQPPSPSQTASGVVPLDTLPADWWNSMLYKLTKNQNATASELTDIMNEMINVLTAADIPPSSQSSQQLLNAIRKVSRTIATASTAGAVISSSASGKVSVDAQGVMTPNGLGVPSNLNTVATDVVSAINELYSTLTNYIQTNNAAVTGLQQGKAPNNHASDQTTYGKGDASNYGHVKLSDATNSTSGVGDGVAATPAAVKAVADAVALIQQNSFDQAHPVGESYIQLPLTKTPNELWGQWSTWEEIIGFNGAFFRSRNIPTYLYSIDGSTFYNDVNRTEPVNTTGCGALTDTGNTEYDQQGNVVKIYTAGTAAGLAGAFIGEGGTLSPQEDMIKTHTTGGMSANESHGHSLRGSKKTGGISNIYTMAAHNGVIGGNVDLSDSQMYTYYNNNSNYRTIDTTSVAHTHTYGNATDHPETRPINYTIRLWKRIR